jgi:hypothetical protein
VSHTTEQFERNALLGMRVVVHFEQTVSEVAVHVFVSIVPMEHDVHTLHVLHLPSK